MDRLLPRGHRLALALTVHDVGTIEWADIERVSLPFLFNVVTMRRALEAKFDALTAVADERRRYVADDEFVSEEREAVATFRELRAVGRLPRLPAWAGVPSAPFAVQMDRRSAHAVALYELIAPQVPASRRRGRKWGGPRPYNGRALRLVNLILAELYGEPLPNLKAVLQKARGAATG